MRNILSSVCLLATLACAPAAFAQDNQTKPAQPAEPAHFYHLKLAVQELDADGKITNSRAYFTTVSTDKNWGENSIRSGTRMPIATSDSSTTVQFQYIDLGTNFDIHNVHESGRELSLHVKVDISSYGGKTPIGSNSGAAYQQPIIRHNQWEAPILIPLDKPTVIFTSDLLENKGAMQVVTTATPIP